MPQVSWLPPISSENCKINLLRGRSLQNTSKATGLLESHLFQKSSVSTLVSHAILQRTESLPSNEPAAAEQLWEEEPDEGQQPRVFSAVHSSSSAFWPKEVNNWTCNNFIEKKKRVIYQNCTKKYLKWTLQNTPYVCWDPSISKAPY